MRLRAAAFSLLLAGAAHAQAPDPSAAVDAAFARWNTRQTPGCAVGVARDGRTVLARGYGMADLEHDVPITPETVFEAGSVSKQFTAAAILLLAADGKLKLDDDVRRYAPEVPDYGARITLDHLLTHTSGLRDWGTVAEIEGWPRGARRHTHAHVLDIVSRQKALNYRPGAEYLYSNTGYNLLAIIAERVSGKSLNDFSRERIFQPLGMTRTQWRDDYARVVKGRAQAYSRGAGGYRLNMPFENVYGNGGLLTTVGDLLTWNQALAEGKLGPSLTEGLVRRGVLTGGEQIFYARGVMLRTWRGAAEIAHSGSTAGYRAYLSRFPAEKVSVALLCNAAEANPTELANQVSGVFLPGLRPLAPAAPQPGGFASRAGVYVDQRTGAVLRLTGDDAGLRTESGGQLTPVAPDRFRSAYGTSEYVFEGSTLRVFGDETAVYRRVTAAPPARPLDYAGVYESDEAVTRYTVAVENGALMLKHTGGAMRLEPAEADRFITPSGWLVRFDRDGRGRVTGLRIGAVRVREMAFRRR